MALSDQERALIDAAREHAVAELTPETPIMVTETIHYVLYGRGTGYAGGGNFPSPQEAATAASALRVGLGVVFGDADYASFGIVLRLAQIEAVALQ